MLMGVGKKIRSGKKTVCMPVVLPVLVLVLVLVISGFWVLPVAAAVVPDIDGAAYVLMEAESGEVLAAENADMKRYPASTTKIMTLVLALEAIERGEAAPEDVVRTSEYAAGMGGSQVYLYPGEERTLHEMLIAVAVGSGNDAAVAVAEHIGGSVEEFVGMMNRRAAELGMSGTHYTNPHGLHDPEHYTTAGDMAKLAQHAVTVPHMLEYTGIYEYQFRGEPKPLVLWNTNRLLKWYDGVDGLKTGYTSEAGRNLVATAKRGDLRLISVVLGVEPVHGHFTETMKLLNYGFGNFGYQLLYQAGERICGVPVEKGNQDMVAAIVTENVGILSRGAEDAAGEYDTEVVVESWPVAPIQAGESIGELRVLRGGEVIRSAELIAAEDVGRMSPGQAWWEIWRSVWRYA